MRATRGIYVSVSFSNGGGTVEAYPRNNNSNGGPICDIPGFQFIWDIATDTAGNVIVPDALGGIYAYKGPQLCGPELGHITGFSYQQAVDAAAIDAAHGKIAVAYHYGRFWGDPGSIAVCTLAKGCTSNLTNRGVFEIFGVTMTHNGDCWAEGWPYSSNLPNLVYYAGCKGPGQLATGFKNPNWGGLDVDNDGHVLAVSTESPAPNETRSELIVYSGCNPKCTLLGGPFLLSPPRKRGSSEYGHLNRLNDRFVAADNKYRQVDVFAYTGHGTGLTYLYSFNSGLGPSAVPVGAAYDPSSQR